MLLRLSSASVRKLTACVSPPELLDEELLDEELLEEELLEEELLDEELLEEEELLEAAPLSPPPPPPPQATSAKLTRHIAKSCPSVWGIGVVGFIVIPVWGFAPKRCAFVKAHVRMASCNVSIPSRLRRARERDQWLDADSRVNATGWRAASSKADRQPSRHECDLAASPDGLP
ncbi:MAG: hypothetical protein IPL70_16325 [Uliginosibacterium sp.]|nr:hypothetical protein [Uliginosibacterium sp.]